MYVYENRFDNYDDDSGDFTNIIVVNIYILFLSRKTS